MHTLITCILPISSAKRTNPRVATTMATIISPTCVLVRRPCPKELHPPIRKALIPKGIILVSHEQLENTKEKNNSRFIRVCR